MSNMFSEEQMQKVQKEKQARQKVLHSHLSKFPERMERFSTISDLTIKDIYSPEDIQEMDYERDLGFPSQYPFTRGVQPSMYWGQLWTMRMFAGWGSAKNTNRRFHHLAQQGQTGLSVAFDYPTLMGYDSDSTMAR